MVPPIHDTNLMYLFMTLISCDKEFKYIDAPFLHLPGVLDTVTMGAGRAGIRVRK